VLKVPELLLPAGNLDKLKVAYQYGADAAYCGVPRFSLRARENEFTLDVLKEGVELAHSMGKKIYFTVNAIPRNSKLSSFPKYLDEMAALKPDGMIMADPGLIYVTRERHPELEVHISVQANTMNYLAVKFWQKLGATRVILSREVSISEISQIKNEVPGMELEVFVHGAICIAHSGRCFMSNYYTQRDANQGACNNACRDKHKIFVTNPRQNNELMEITESEDEGTFLMNSKDLRAIEFLEEITKAGVDSVKVEGRTKNDYYVALVSLTYRKALDDLSCGKPFDRSLLTQLDKVASRRYFSGFLTKGMEDKVPREEQDFQNYEEGVSRIQTQMYAGKVKLYDAENQLAYFDAKNKIKIGDTIEIFMPGSIQTHSTTVTEIFHKNKPKEAVSGGLGEVAISLPFEVPVNSFISVRS
jgi:U32 family peptidase